VESRQNQGPRRVTKILNRGRAISHERAEDYLRRRPAQAEGAVAPRRSCSHAATSRCMLRRLVRCGVLARRFSSRRCGRHPPRRRQRLIVFRSTPSSRAIRWPAAPARSRSVPSPRSPTANRGGWPPYSPGDGVEVVGFRVHPKQTRHTRGPQQATTPATEHQGK
jgi:hypothetical protein